MNTSITADTTVAKLVDVWLGQLRDEGRLENTTINEYERVLRKQVVSEIGHLTLNELSTSRFDAVLADLGSQSQNLQRKAKVVTGAMLDAAVELGTLSANPVRGSMSVPRPKTERRELTAADLQTVRAAVGAWMGKERPGPKSSGDMADIIDLMLATGACIVEVLALRWSDVDLDERTLAINATLKTDPGKGTYRKPRADPRIVAARVRGHRAPRSSRHAAGRRRRRGLPDAERDLAAGQQRRGALAADPEGHRSRVGDATCVPRESWPDGARHATWFESSSSCWSMRSSRLPSSSVSERASSAPSGAFGRRVSCRTAAGPKSIVRSGSM
jgi:integrase